jgi:hypothetical protein
MRTYPNFLLFHPRDHIKHWSDADSRKRPLKAGSKGYWQEIQATGCKQPQQGQPYECPRGGGQPNPGVVAVTYRTYYLAMDQINSELLLLVVVVVVVVVVFWLCQGGKTRHSRRLNWS